MARVEKEQVSHSGGKKKKKKNSQTFIYFCNSQLKSLNKRHDFTEGPCITLCPSFVKYIGPFDIFCKVEVLKTFLVEILPEVEQNQKLALT